MAQELDAYHRRSIRLPGYDYHGAGAYFVTLCTAGRRCLFGHVEHGHMHLNPCGHIAHEEWLKTGEMRARVHLDTFVIMPNHLHGILILLDPPHNTDTGITRVESFSRPISESIPTILRQYKSATTRRIHTASATPVDTVWQRNYYERVIRNEREMDAIRRYIVDNPLHWEADPDNPTRAHLRRGGDKRRGPPRHR